MKRTSLLKLAILVVSLAIFAVPILALYTPPDSTKIDLDVGIGYTSPDSEKIDLDLFPSEDQGGAAADPCDMPTSAGDRWVVPADCPIDCSEIGTHFALYGPVSVPVGNACAL